MNYSTQHWRAYFDDLGINPFFVESYLFFIEECLSRGIPPIFELDHLSLLLGRTKGHLGAMIHATPSYYREFRIKKRTGGTRKIVTPLPSLLECQRWIATHVLGPLPTSVCATGYKKNSSIKRNAILHCNRDILAKLDVVDFFGSIKVDRVVALFTRLGYPRNVAYALARLCTLNGKLPQGAATSPMIANLICAKMDDQLYRFCRKRGLRYTRYSDDIAISGRNISKSDLRYVHEVLESYGFQSNKDKFRILNAGDKKIVTGLDITTGAPRPTREFRRQLSKDIYFAWSAGLEAHLSRERIFHPRYLESLRGRLEFWRWVEPDNPQIAKHNSRLSEIEKAATVF